MAIQVGIGLPTAVPGVRGDQVLDWARRADAGPFSSIAVTDRLVDPTYEALTTLAAVAGVSERVRLVSAVLLSPLRNGAVLAKQAATVDALSNGRLTLGLGVGIRNDDYDACGLRFSERGRHFDEQLALMKRIWRGDPASDRAGPVGPAPSRAGGPEVLIGARSAAAIRRVGRWADGYIAARESPADAAEHYRLAEESWRDAGRSGRPRFVMVSFFSLADPVEAAAWARHYYAFRGPLADKIAESIVSTPEGIRESLQTFEAIGVEEMIFMPCSDEIAQVEALADVVG